MTLKTLFNNLTHTQIKNISDHLFYYKHQYNYYFSDNNFKQLNLTLYNYSKQIDPTLPPFNSEEYLNIYYKNPLYFFKYLDTQTISNTIYKFINKNVPQLIQTFYN